MGKFYLSKWWMMKLLIFLLLFVGNTYADQKYEDLDGIFIKAVDQYPALKKNEFSIGFNFLPFNPYRFGAGLTLGFSRYFNKKWGWEVLNADYVMPIDKGLVAALAGASQQPDGALEETNYIISSNLKYVLSYGKNIFFDKYIKLNRSEFKVGVGTIGTSQTNYISANIGFELDFSISEKMSWKIEFIDYITFQRGTGTFMDFGAFKAKLAWRF